MDVVAIGKEITLKDELRISLGTKLFPKVGEFFAALRNSVLAPLVPSPFLGMSSTALRGGGRTCGGQAWLRSSSGSTCRGLTLLSVTIVYYSNDKFTRKQRGRISHINCFRKHRLDLSGMAPSRTATATDSRNLVSHQMSTLTLSRFDWIHRYNVAHYEPFGRNMSFGKEGRVGSWRCGHWGLVEESREN